MSSAELLQSYLPEMSAIHAMLAIPAISAVRRPFRPLRKNRFASVQIGRDGKSSLLLLFYPIIEVIVLV